MRFHAGLVSAWSVIRHENREVDTRVHGAGWTRIPTSR